MLAGALALGGCATPTPPRPAAPPSASAPPSHPGGSPGPAAQPAQEPAATPPVASTTSPRTALAETLAIEQKWLQDWFRGTPVRVVLQSQGVLAVDVPREFCFDAGSAQIKPALAAVLNKVAESLRRRANTRVTLLTAPADPGAGAAGAALALQRAVRVQRALRDQGLAAARAGEPLAEGQTGVQLRIGALAP